MPNQIDILETLKKMKRATTGEMADKLQCSQNTIQMHLLRLLAQGRVSREPRILLPPERGSEYVYTINQAGLERLGYLKESK